MRKYDSVINNKPEWFCGFWNNDNLSISEMEYTEPRKEEVWHYHSNMEEYYLAVGGRGLLSVYNKDGNIPILLKPGKLVRIDPREIHKINKVFNPEKYGTLHLVVIKNPSIDGDKTVV